MDILLNNRPEHFDSDELTVTEIMRLKSFHFKLLVVKLNGTLIDKQAYGSTVVREGDNLLIIHLVSGG